jgi:hypothetical protein
MDQTQLIKPQSRRYEIVKQAGRRRKENRQEMGEERCARSHPRRDRQRRDVPRLGETGMKLDKKVAVITGGNSGIGLATAREFRANGAKVVIFGRDRATLDRAAADLGHDALAVQGDVRRISACSDR